MKIKFISLVLTSIFCLFILDSCTKDKAEESGEAGDLPSYLSYLEPSSQRIGDVEAGRDYLIYGNYVSGGVPYTEEIGPLIDFLVGSDENALNREGDNATMPHNFNLTDAPNGVRILAANCLTCHAEYLNGELIVGLGNNTYDYSQGSKQTLVETVTPIILNNHGEDSPEWEAFSLFRKATIALGQIVPTIRGVNIADVIFGLLAAHRDRDDLEWNDEPLLALPSSVLEETVISDVPAWWHLKKRNTMFYTGLGRGDFSKIMMASNMLTMKDSTEAREVDSHFPDVYAFIKSLEAPPYPEEINIVLANQGKTIFDAQCSTCHGTYGLNETYPNLAVDINYVGTDPRLAENYIEYSEYVSWYNESWFAQVPYSASFEPEMKYIAPPLDGIWATAPYLHNGSVPDLRSLLRSEERPQYWRRSFDNSDYNYEKLGWNYSEEVAGGDSGIYNTTIQGYGNEGHNFGDNLGEEELEAVLEYLKSL